MQLDLGPFNVLIGRNDSGKTSLLDAIQVLGWTANQAWSSAVGKTGPISEVVWKKQPNSDVTWQVQGTTPDTNYSYELALSPGQQWPKEERLIIAGQLARQHPPKNLPKGTKPNVFQLSMGRPGDVVHYGDNTGLLTCSKSNIFTGSQAIASNLGSTHKLKLDADQLRSNAERKPDPILASNGGNLVAVLDSILTGPDRQAILELEDALRREIPTLDGISLQPLPGQPGFMTLKFTLPGSERQKVTIPATQASDGAMLLLAFLALFYGNTPEILLIEEPENGLHPSRLQEVVALLRKISTGEIGTKPRLR